MTLVAKKSLEAGKEHLEKQCSQAFDQLNQVGSLCVAHLALTTHSIGSVC